MRQLARAAVLLMFLLAVSACSPSGSAVTPVPSIPSASFPAAMGPDPSERVSAFYYPWYGTPATDGGWVHWNDKGHQPPRSISSDYFPQLGAYSSADPVVVAQHMAWLRQAGVGVVITSWWGPGSREDRNVALVLAMAQRYGIKVAFHIEPYAGRTATSLVADVSYLNSHYGSSPAFYRSSAATRYTPSGAGHGMFFLYCPGYLGAGCGTDPVQAGYWRAAVDAIHALPDGGLVIASTTQGSWIDGAHFDGLYNYVTLDLDKDGGFAWARSLPPGALYIPSVIPGNSAKRVGYPPQTYVPRNDGATFAHQWTAALNTGVEPAMVSITSFNEWHEGSMIEPPARDADDGAGYTYATFGGLAPTGYLDLTRQWADTFLARRYPTTYRARVQITTTSDWTTLNVAGGGSWFRPGLVSASPGATSAAMEGDRMVLMQPLAKIGTHVQMIYDMQLTGLDPAGTLHLNLDRGNAGSTTVTIYAFAGSNPVPVKTVTWGGVTTGRNSFNIDLPAGAFINP